MSAEIDLAYRALSRNVSAAGSLPAVAAVPTAVPANVFRFRGAPSPVA